ncbi:hypothetical protein BN2476_670024 [Paraburkholderia piptadeniae]|uniref:Uncharacterized protein n=1 Tax=Paraburkholderia piptadeniae TaxID=1701573 RepID=A0A1N7SNK1_9BURK|nr:hypothetical protein BN2476_670024 [Paraburkholderia piptadeniae]
MREESRSARDETTARCEVVVRWWGVRSNVLFEKEGWMSSRFSKAICIVQIRAP